MSKFRWPAIVLLGLAAFVVTGRLYTAERADTPQELSGQDRVVISAPLQLLIYAGDRFLAANLETMRLLTTASPHPDEETALYQTRAHNLVSKLNPCHEDNYYLAAAILSWGGFEKEGSEILKKATACRDWDWIPPFYYAFNQYFFNRDNEEAQRYMRIAAERSPANRASLLKTAIMLSAHSLNDDAMALNYLKNERDKAKDPKLKRMLAKRVGRMQGLIVLREAQARYEKKFGKELVDPNELLTSGILSSFPPDPLGIGYEFDKGRMQLRTIKIH